MKSPDRCDLKNTHLFGSHDHDDSSGFFMIHCEFLDTWHQVVIHLTHLHSVYIHACSVQKVQRVLDLTLHQASAATSLQLSLLMASYRDPFTCSTSPSGDCSLLSFPYNSMLPSREFLMDEICSRTTHISVLPSTETHKYLSLSLRRLIDRLH